MTTTQTDAAQPVPRITVTSKPKPYHPPTGKPFELKYTFNNAAYWICSAVIRTVYAIA